MATGSQVARASRSVAQLRELLLDSPRCAQLARLSYVDREAPGLVRRKRGRGFAYTDVRGKAVDAATRERIKALAIPPAWREVWICADADGHLLATGIDDRGRTQYLYHPRWREVRDVINFYRLTEIGRALPMVRAEIDRQLRRRTIDRAHVIATMLWLSDRYCLRVGSEEYADENDSVGLCTLERRHVRVNRARVELDFVAKSGRRVELRFEDAAVARVLTSLLKHRGRRLFRVDGRPITPEDVNQRIAELTGGAMTIKDFRTWRGTSIAFEQLRKHADAEDREHHVIEAVDAASAALGNTRAVARAHYVHPHVVASYLDGTFAEQLAASSRPRLRGLTANECALLGYLDHLLHDYAPRAVARRAS